MPIPLQERVEQCEASFCLYDVQYCWNSFVGSMITMIMSTPRYIYYDVLAGDESDALREHIHVMSGCQERWMYPSRRMVR